MTAHPLRTSTFPLADDFWLLLLLFSDIFIVVRFAGFVSFQKVSLLVYVVVVLEFFVGRIQVFCVEIDSNE